MSRRRWRHAGWVALVAGICVSMVAAACGNAPAGRFSAGADSTGVTSREILVGGMAAVSGPLGNQYSPAFAGAQAYFDMVNAAGGVHGRRIRTVAQLDDSTDPSADVASARALVERYGVFAVVPVATPVFAGAGYLAGQGVPTFGYNINPDDWKGRSTLFGQDGSYLDPTGIDVAGPYLAHQLGLQRIAVLSYAVTQSAQCAVGQTRSFRKLGFDVTVVDSSLPIGVADVSADVARIQTSGAQLVVLCMDPSGDAMVSSGLARAGLTQVAQYWIDGYDDASLAQFAAAYEGAYLTTDFVPFEEAGRSHGLQEFLAQMRRRFPQVQIGVVSLAGWISAAMLVEGLQRAGRHPTRQKLVAAVNSLRAFSAGGIETPVDWRVDHTSRGALNCEAYLQARQGHFVPLYGQPFVCIRNDAATPAQLVPSPAPPGS